MSQQNTQRQLPYDHPAVQNRASVQLAANSAGSGSTSGKFTAWAALQVYGARFFTTTPGTSTYTVAGTATAQATQLSALYVTNTNTTGTAITLATNTVGPFTVGGTSTTGANVSVGGFAGGLAGGYNGPYAINTLGGTNTTQAWGLTTFTASNQGPPGGGSIGLGGLPMAPADTIQFVMGTDATAVIIPVLEYGLQPVNVSVLA